MIQVDSSFGPYDSDAGWVPPLRYLMRRYRILNAMRNLAPAPLLEVGCGAGMLLAELAGRGYECVGLETSGAARQLAQRLAGRSGKDYRVVGSAECDWPARFAYVAAFDVLEHIERDSEALGVWRGWLKDNGRLVLSVPAHSRRWGPGDEWAGHFRRYDAPLLRKMLGAAGYEIEHFECYGFPIANMTEWLGRWMYARLLAKRAQATSQAQATALSGVDRGAYLRLFVLMRMPPFRWLIQIGMKLQSLFMRTDWGSGYLVVARKR